MTTPPKLSFACPMPWTQMSGTERSRFCEQCGHHVRNLSLMSSTERAELLQRSGTGRVCGTYYVRLSGEMVTPDAPLTRAEQSRVRQFGVAALTATALALAGGCVTLPSQQADLAPGATQIIAERSGAPVEKAPDVAPCSTPPDHPAVTAEKKEEEMIILFTGIVATTEGDRAQRVATLLAAKRHPAK